VVLRVRDECLPALRDPHYDRVVRISARNTRSRETVVLLPSHRLGAMAVAIVLWAASPGWAGASPPPSEPDDVMAHVGELFRSGQDRFETSDFKGAIESWGQAYEDLPDGPEHQAIRAMLLANLAQAHVEAHAMGGELEHLHQADDLFARYLAMIDPADVETHESIGAERKRIAGILAEAEAQQREQEQAARAEQDARATGPEQAQLEAASDGSSSVERMSLVEFPYSPGERAMVIGGGVTLALGVGLTGAAGAFLWLRTEEEKRGSAASRNPATGVGELREFGQNAIRFNRLAISTGAASGVLTAIGLGLVGTAAVHRRRRWSDRTTVGLGPGTLIVRGRF